MTPEDRYALVRYRLEKAARTLRQAEALGAIAEWDGAVNRAYYTMFYAALAMLAQQGLAAHRHTGVLALVDRELVRRDLLPAAQAARLREAFRLRQRADYAETEPMDAERGRELLGAAKVFLDEVRARLGAMGDRS